jgi:hypothetical protein
VYAGLLISIIAVDTIGDTFEVSLSAILLDVSIAIGDTFFDCIAIDYRDTFREYR